MQRLTETARFAQLTTNNPRRGGADGTRGFAMSLAGPARGEVKARERHGSANNPRPHREP